jgi:hypothetical protein
MSYYYYSSSSQQSYGPYRASEIRSMLAAGSATLEDFVSEDGENWVPIREWMQQAPQEKPTGDKPRKHHSRSRSSRSHHGYRSRRSGIPGSTRRTTSLVLWIFIFLLLLMVGGAVWLYLESEKNQVGDQTTQPVSEDEAALIPDSGSEENAEPPNPPSEEGADETEVVMPGTEDVPERMENQ